MKIAVTMIVVVEIITAIAATLLVIVATMIAAVAVTMIAITVPMITIVPLGMVIVTVEIMWKIEGMIMRRRENRGKHFLFKPPFPSTTTTLYA